MKWLLWGALIVLIALLTTGGIATWFTWQYLSWVRTRRQWFVEHGNRKRTSR